jgi:hypothetical protein
VRVQRLLLDQSLEVWIVAPLLDFLPELELPRSLSD